MSHMSHTDLHRVVYCALFTALIIIGGYISIPIGPVPMTLADFFVMMAGLFLGLRYGVISVVVYIGLGALGLPIFAGGRAGLGVLMGPTGGFLIGYVCMAAAIGVIMGKGKVSTVRCVMALLAGNIFLYAMGISWLKIVAPYMGVIPQMSWPAALAAGLIPFVPGMVVKIAVASALGRAFLLRFSTLQTRSVNKKQ
ncbi:MAG: biotin transporter BioY [Peptococcaceae bacterium]|nr:biotin transporter BioY [Peptococcaceae bacterium]